ncbi:MAG: 3-hydroxyacyl-CoA dehydrogenase family protein [Paludibacteraceae bacterium]|nr:3-hydroxyacyl-CoA dehydrogenase family protein [Paludibacteraceae bacterium]MBN2788367.1 3-hydroxyacyl-CoA dehydrogenase family protein [Paludibacteraceae bacterium]
MAETITEPIEKYGLSKQKRKRTLFSKIGVVGCGKEGSYIVTIAAIKGMEVVFLEPTEERVNDAYLRVEDKLNKRIVSWGLTVSEKKAILSRIKGTTEFKDFAGCDFVIETIRYDDMGVRSVQNRKEVFAQLEFILSKEAIIASNVSTIFVTELANELQYKERAIGFHFLSSSLESNILEIVPGVCTSKETYEHVCQFAKLINHAYVTLQESVGLVTLRLFFVQLNEACAILMEGVASVDDIDKVLMVGYGHKQGIFLTADQMGVEKIVHLMENMFQEYGNVKYKPSPYLNRLYRSNQYGVSKKKGFYLYDEEGNVTGVNTSVFPK